MTTENAIIVLDVLWGNPLLSDIHKEALKMGVQAIKAVDPKTGYWECNELFYNGENRGAIIRCSKCGNEFKVSPKVFENLYDNERFCNHCGAKMESEI